MNVLKKLGVKCSYKKCGEDFSNRISTHMSGIHMDHHGKKNRGPSAAMAFYIHVSSKSLLVAIVILPAVCHELGNGRACSVGG